MYYVCFCFPGAHACSQWWKAVSVSFLSQSFRSIREPYCAWADPHRRKAISVWKVRETFHPVLGVQESRVHTYQTTFERAQWDWKPRPIIPINLLNFTREKLWKACKQCVLILLWINISGILRFLKLRALRNVVWSNFKIFLLYLQFPWCCDHLFLNNAKIKA